MIAEIILGLLVIVLLAWVTFKKPAGLPPGKWGLPGFGYIPLDGKYVDDKMLEFKKQFGDVYIWRFGRQPMAFVHDYHTVRQMFNHPDFMDRPDFEILKKEGVQLGVLGSNGSIWHDNRRFCLRQLRDLGMGKSVMVTAIQEQARNLVEELKKDVGKDVMYPEAMTTAILNLIWKMVANKNFKSDDPVNKHLQELLIQMTATFTYACFSSMFKWMQYIIPGSVFRKMFKMDAEKEAEDKFDKYCSDLIKEHEEHLNPDDPQDMMDAYLIEMNEKKDDKDIIRSHVDLKVILLDLFVAGTDTTASTMEWVLLYLAAFPDKQRKLQEEIDRVLTKDEPASSEDRPKMPYTDAVINEVLRKSSLVNFGVHHATARDTTLNGFTIPKGTMVASASYCIHHDERYWDQPDRFLPERWIGPDGKFVMKKEGYIPFGIGKRNCIGEGLARMEIFVFTTSIFQSFNIAPPEGKQIDLMHDLNVTFGHRAKAQGMVFTLRG